MIVRKKPIELEAIRFEPGSDQLQCEWWYQACCNGVIKFCYDTTKGPYALIQTLEGDMRAYVGSYIVRGTKGELWPVRADIFEETYEILKGW